MSRPRIYKNGAVPMNITVDNELKEFILLKGGSSWINSLVRKVYDEEMGLQFKERTGLENRCDKHNSYYKDYCSLCVMEKNKEEKFKANSIKINELMKQIGSFERAKERYPENIASYDQEIQKLKDEIEKLKE